MKKASIYNNDLKDNKQKRRILLKKLNEKGFKTGENGDFIFVIGGDGTFLKAILKNMKRNPIFVGINTGHLGFLTEFKFEDIDRVINMINKKEFKIDNIPVFEAIISAQKNLRRVYFVNDLVVERKETRIIHLELTINEKKFCNLSGDGIIYSTPIGSTGYNNAARGSIILDEKEIVQLTPLNPVNTEAYHSLSSPIILKNNNEITIQPNYKKNRPLRIVCDGNEITLKNIKSVSIKKTPFNVRLLRSSDYSQTKNVINKILK